MGKPAFRRDDSQQLQRELAPFPIIIHQGIPIWAKDKVISMLACGVRGRDPFRYNTSLLVEESKA